MISISMMKYIKHQAKPRMQELSTYI